MKCRLCGKESFFEMCESCIRKHNPNWTNKIWKSNKKLAEGLGEAYYDSLLKEYDQKTIRKDSKENFGFNTFCDGIWLGLDIVMPILDASSMKAAEQKIKDMLKIRKTARNRGCEKNGE